MSEKIIVTSTGKELSNSVDPNFGRTKYLMVIDLETNSIENVYDNKENMNAPTGAGVQTSQKVSDLKVKNIITGKVGPRSFRILKTADINIWTTKQITVEEAIKQYKDGKLKIMPD